MTQEPPRLTPDQLRQLRDELPPYTGRETDSPLMQAFCRDYGLDFGGRFPGARHSAGKVGRDGEFLAVHCWRQAGAAANLLLVHGYFDHSGLYGKLIEYGLARNCNVLIFDLPGHGLSSGEPVVIDDFADYGRAIGAVLDGVPLPDLPLWTMAQSTGCAALVEFARGRPGNPWPFAATVLLAPLVRPRGWQRVRAAHVLMGPFAEGVSRKYAENSSDPAFLQSVRDDPLQSRQVSLRWVAALRRWLKALPREDLGVGPALVVQGDADQTVDWRFNLLFVATLFPGSQMEIIPGAGHHLANESTPLREGWLQRVTAYLAARGLPTAAPAPAPSPASTEKTDGDPV